MDGFWNDEDLEAAAEALSGGPVAPDPRALGDLIGGIAAAPRLSGDGWLDLLGAPEAPLVRAALTALRDHAARHLEAAPTQSPAERLGALRAELATLGLDGLVVPHSDEYQNEFLPTASERLAWLTDFTGSAGAAAVLMDRAAVFVDGRYTLQARDQVDPTLYEIHHLVEAPLASWLEGALGKGARLGFDPWLHTLAEKTRLEAACAKVGATLVALEVNPLERVWTTRPPAPLSPARPHALDYAGEASADKRARLGAALAKEGRTAAVITAPDSVAWLFNLRGGDLSHTPLSLSRAILRADGGADLFLDGRKVTVDLPPHLGNGVTLRDPGELGAALDALGADGATVLVDPQVTPVWVADRLEAAGATLAKGMDPCVLPRARKNAVELAGSRAAHRRDGLAMVKFLHWLSETAPEGGVTELSAAERLARFRGEDSSLRDLSFATISGAGPNGAIVHYRVTPRTDRPLDVGSLYLVDSGGQYPDGTTDITRTVAIGAPSAEARRCFTLVLKGHVALAMARFPKGTTGAQLDVLARAALWAEGLDYDHGTGHGVGSFLGVHEGPARISKAANTVALEPGMILSNEPGYYREGAFGIRVENLMAVRMVDPAPAGADRPFLEFETLTLAPIDRALIDVSLLDVHQRAWIDAYHARVREAHAPHLSGAVLAWLNAATAPLAR
jgi:Xaa-Pro aminopeptidase